MTQDHPLVARLRARSFDYTQTGRGSEGVLLDEAAEAIERLQAAPAVDAARLMALADEALHLQHEATTYHNAWSATEKVRKARAALESALQSALAAQPAPTEQAQPVAQAMADRAELSLDALKALPRKLLDVAGNIRTHETLFRDDELVDQAAHAIEGALRYAAPPRTPSRPEGRRTVNKRDLDLLERAFVCEINAAITGSPRPMQTKAKARADALVADGLLVPSVEVWRGITIEVYELTHAGRFVYCSTCEGEDAAQETTR
jgi:hypothetical protein